MYAPAIHVTIGSWDAIASHDYHDQVQCTGLLTKKVVGGIVGCSGLRNLAVRAGLQSMNEIRKEDGIVDEENWNVDSNNVLKA